MLPKIAKIKLVTKCFRHLKDINRKAPSKPYKFRKKSVSAIPKSASFSPFRLDDCAYLMNIYVRKEHRGEGAGFSEMRDMMLLTYGK